MDDALRRAEAYKKAFRQQSVIIILRPACVSF